MISCAALERPGKWRLPALIAGLLLAFAPAIALLLTLQNSAGAPTVFTSVFAASLLRSFAVALLVSVLSVVVGLPTGVMAGLYEFPLRRLWLVLLALPLLVPSFITAIGLSMLRIALGLSADGFLSGFTGTVLAFATFGVPLVTFIALASVRGISRSQVDAARLAGGERHVVRCVARTVFPSAALTGLLAGVLTLSEPGPGQILGYSGAASEILVSFASQYDFALATRQCLVLTGAVFVLALPAALLFAPRLAAGLLARDVIPAPLTRMKWMKLAGPLWFLVLLVMTVAMPLLGFAQPLLRSFPAGRAFQEVERTIGSTVLYSVTASLLAIALGVVLAICVGREGRLRVILLVGLLLLFSLPPSLGALGWIQLAGGSPAQFDFALRSPFTVSVALALRFLPIAAIFALRSLGTTSSSWASAAAVHGVPLATYARRVLAPWMASAMLPAALLIVLLATADVSSMLLLHPPGRGSLPLAIFTVMANAPESLVGALCLAYVGGAALLLVVGWLVTVLLRRRT
jgi:iron(III) transport system permease protein